MRLKSINAIVTGGASGIGRAICELFADEGAHVLIADIDEHGGRETVSRIQNSGGTSQFVKTDVSEEQSVESLVDHAISEMGSLDVLINDAAAFVFEGIETVSKSDWDKVFSVNVIGAANLVKYSLPHLKVSTNSAIVNIASVSSFIAQHNFIPYNSSKGALLQLTRCLAMDLAPFDIRVNCVCPGAIYTSATERHIESDGADRDEFLKAAAEKSFLKRMGRPEEVAKAALFLASEDASYITGSHLVVDGGATVG